MAGLNVLEEIFAEQYRRRSEWNARFAHWEKSESNTETARIERARNMVQAALGQNAWLASQGVTIAPQGSFYNRTNSRNESDIDLRVQHPALKIECASGVDVNHAWRVGGYSEFGATHQEIVSRMRQEIERELRAKFGAADVDAGRKAIRVNGLDGSRAEVDVVPALTLHHYYLARSTSGLGLLPGAAILGTDGAWTFNYPECHTANGRAKRLATGLRFKRIVRTVKSLRADMIERQVIFDNVPSFLVECLVYLVEDPYFLIETDDKYDRVRRVLLRIAEILNGTNIFAVLSLREISGAKLLFGPGQAWTLDSAKNFVHAAIAHMGNC